ncbi:MAG TPA: hypothetical protein VHX87_02750 [Galbitalea sp.]|jgi:hypothetical protein|nr:hypothetical protein [Galbitalea sp.]
MTRYIGPAMLAVLAGAGCWFFGLAIIPSIVVVIVVGAIVVTLREVVAPDDTVLTAGIVQSAQTAEWPPGPPLHGDGARRDVSELGWALRTPSGIVEDRVLDRVRAIAATSLRRRRLDLENPADRARIERLVGPPLYLLLTAAGRQRTSARTLRSLLGTLEALERTDPGARN